MSWKDIPDFRGLYSASTDGVIRNNKTGRFLKPALKKSGYLQLSLRKNGRTISCLVHSLVASAFEISQKGKQINHKDGDKTNNSLENLEAVSASFNIKHSLQTGLRKKNHLKDDDMKFVLENYIPRHQSLGQTALAIKYNVNQSVISRLINKNTYKDII